SKVVDVRSYVQVALKNFGKSMYFSTLRAFRGRGLPYVRPCTRATVAYTVLLITLADPLIMRTIPSIHTIRWTVCEERFSQATMSAATFSVVLDMVEVEMSKL